jgi:hypothetical protein
MAPCLASQQGKGLSSKSTTSWDAYFRARLHPKTVGQAGADARPVAPAEMRSGPACHLRTR